MTQGKIFKLKKRIIQFFIEKKYFGFTIASINFFWPILIKVPYRLVSKLLEKKNNKVNAHLIGKYNNIIEKYKTFNVDDFNDNSNDSKSPIWVCWLQGESEMPEVPRICLSKIRKYANEHSVNLLSLENYSDYVKLPEYIIQKYKNNQINNANFTDIIRTVLLSEIGGCWIDSTILMTDYINEDIFSRQFYSIKLPKTNYYITENLWSNFFIAAKKNSLIFNYTKDMFYEYLKYENIFIDYFLMDYIIKLGYDRIPIIKKTIDNTPINNTNTHLFVSKIYNQNNITDLGELRKNTYLFKLSWRMKVNDSFYCNVNNLCVK